MKNRQKINRFILVLIIIGLAIFISKNMVSHKKRPQRLVHESSGAVVNVMTVQRTGLNSQVTGTGLVKPLQEVQMAPQISGTVVYTSPNLVQSGFFKKGDILFRIEDTDAILALEQASADLTGSKLELAQVEAQATIALEEWQLLNEDDVEPHPLTVYKPQLASARGMVAAAKAQVKLAELDVQRTTIVAPFNCFVRSKNVDIGQYVSTGKVVLNLVGTDKAEIMVPLSLADIAVVSTPAKRASEHDSSVTIRLDVGGITHTWQGYVDRFGGEVDATSRMRDVIVVVDDPYNLAEQGSTAMPLVMGSFVTVDIAGRRYNDVVEIPRMGLRDGSTVWVVQEDSTLQIREVIVLRKNRENVIIKDGLDDGDQIILTPLRGASPGMKLRVQQGEKS